MSKKYESIDALRDVIAVFPLADTVLLPRGQLPLNIFEPRYLALLDHALGNGRFIGIIQPDEEQDAKANKKPALYKTGCLGRIVSFSEADDDTRILVALTGVCRFRIAEELNTTTPYRQIRADYAPYKTDLIAEAGAMDVNRDALLAVLRRYLEAHDLSADWDAIEQSSNEALVNSLSIISPFGGREKQALLEASSLSERNEILIALTEMALAQDAQNKHGTEGQNDNDISIQ